MNISAGDKNKPKTFTTKKCPNCLTYLPLEAKICTSCNIKVGEIGKNQMAKRPVNWMSYIICFFAWMAFGLYLLWLFTKD